MKREIVCWAVAGAGMIVCIIAGMTKPMISWVDVGLIVGSILVTAGFCGFKHDFKED